MTDRDRARLAWAAAGALSVGGGVHAALRGPAWMDAAFVPFRYARNFADGHGLVFNRGERVEGFLDPLWTMLWALATTVGVDPVSATAVVGPALVAALVRATAWLWVSV